MKLLITLGSFTEQGIQPDSFVHGLTRHCAKDLMAYALEPKHARTKVCQRPCDGEAGAALRVPDQHTMPHQHAARKRDAPELLRAYCG